MSTFYCSVITPPSRFSSREAVYAMNSFHAFQYIQEKYRRVLNFCPDAIVLVENSKEYTYFNWIGVDITQY